MNRLMKSRYRVSAPITATRPAEVSSLTYAASRLIFWVSHAVSATKINTPA